MRHAFKAAAVSTAVVMIFCADVTLDLPFGVRLVSEAHAIVGLPFTPLSFAGVARRTAFRTAAWTSAAATSAAAASQAGAAQAAAAHPPPPPPPPAAAPAAVPPPPPAPAPAAAPAGGTLPLGTIVHVLPAGCTSTPVGGQEYFYCSGNFYRPAFSGNNLVYVTTRP
jgi:hypothetical protein